jgi:hypothetical protein
MAATMVAATMANMTVNKYSGGCVTLKQVQCLTIKAGRSGHYFREIFHKKQPKESKEEFKCSPYSC